jgi:CheY-like chemotaxis protein
MQTMRRPEVTPRRLLLIEDHELFRQTLARLLRMVGHAVVEATEGSAGLASLRRYPADLVITDRDMPGLTGWDVARLVKATHPRLPVLLVTGGPEAGPVTRQPSPNSVDAILWKPFLLRELLAQIARLTGGDGETAEAGGGWEPGVPATRQPEPGRRSWREPKELRHE